ncbi:hypothetical protein AYO36_05710 [Exiguobacterium sp. KKBO11]|uniref:DUF402 domain-containing protein n=1 Tax=Exiguobacterium sp. KKBO11 TaxID=1805000 RepID=UPI0007D82C9B|nr:DUF402 domain-containing protein [Exiguobacterium sp. KKBO11]OAI89646.1 hypothetical protein AYO36_05710 [Exiguobacterium sp. KKBO11]
MIKKRYANRRDWRRITQRHYVQEQVENELFKGHVTLLQLIEVASPLDVRYGDETIRIADAGYVWVQQFPSDAHHAVTSMFDATGQLVQTYIDICLRTGVEDGRIYWEDLFLDLIALPSGQVLLVDADELEAAREQGDVSQAEYALALAEAKQLQKQLQDGTFPLVAHVEVMKERLELQLKQGTPR